MAVSTMQRGFDFAFVRPFRAALSHGNQALVTSAAAYMSAMFSMQHDVLPYWIAIPLAIGFEWTYLRGLASAGKTHSGWVSALNWGALVTSAVYGILYCLGRFDIIPATPSAELAAVLAAAHVGPMAFMSLASANVHRATAMEERRHTEQINSQERDRLLRLQAERDAIALEDERKNKELDRWKSLQRAKRELQAETQPTQPSATATKAQPVVYEGVEYPSIQACADAHGISRQAMKKRLDKVARNH